MKMIQEMYINCGCLSEVYGSSYSEGGVFHGNVTFLRPDRVTVLTAELLRKRVIWSGRGGGGGTGGGHRAPFFP